MLGRARGLTNYGKETMLRIMARVQRLKTADPAMYGKVRAHTHTHTHTHTSIPCTQDCRTTVKPCIDSVRARSVHWHGHATPIGCVALYP